ncbi:hypothetical protein ACLB2K_016914 [Fragaria x ananassa]
MAGGTFNIEGGGKHYEGNITLFVIFTCVVAASGGLLFGYDIGISGGVTSMEPFLSKFFPSVEKKMKNSGDGNMHQIIHASSETAIHAGVPALMLIIGSFFLPDTPNSILARGHPNEAKKVLQKVRGTENVEEEFQDLIQASEAAKKVEHPWANITQPKYRPQLVICCLIPLFQQLTGINAIMFYAPVLFKTLGMGNDASLISAIITGSVNVIATIVSIVTVDRRGRRALFLEGGVQMIVCQIAVAILIGLKFGVSGVGSLTKGEADFLLFLVCIYVAGFAWSWGPLGWLVPSEICPLEIRSAGQAINVSVNMLFTFVIGQAFLTMLCSMKFGLFFFFAGFVIIMTIFVAFFIPETKNVPIEEINTVWKAHWFWGKYIPDDSINDGTDNKGRVGL